MSYCVTHPFSAYEYKERYSCKKTATAHPVDMSLILKIRQQ